MKTLFRNIAVAAGILLTLAVPMEGRARCVEAAARQTLHVKDGIAFDNATGLEWQRCVAGTRWNSAKKRCDGRVKGMAQPLAASAARRAGPGWRLPNVQELQSLRLNACKGPKIDTRIFPNIGSADFGEGINVWSSTTAITRDTFYYVDFTDGLLDFHSKGFELAVLLVRNKPLRNRRATAGFSM